MILIREYIFKIGGSLLALMFGYYACVSGSVPQFLLFSFYSLMSLALTFNDTLDLKI